MKKNSSVLCVCVCVFFTLLTDRASTIPSNIRGCQSGMWSAGQEKIGGPSAKLQREHKKQEQKTGLKRQIERKKRMKITLKQMPQKISINKMQRRAGKP